MFDNRRIILIVIVIVLIYLFYYIGSPSNEGAYDGSGSGNIVRPEVYAVDLPTGFFASIYPDYDSIGSDGYMKNKDGSYLDLTKLGLTLATVDQVYQAAIAKDGGVGAQFIGYGLMAANEKLQLGFPRQSMIDNVGLTTSSASFNSTVPGIYTAYNNKATPVTAILYGLKPIQGSVVKIGGRECPIRPWFVPDQANAVTVKSVYSQNVSLNL